MAQLPPKEVQEIDALVYRIHEAGFTYLEIATLMRVSRCRAWQRGTNHERRILRLKRIGDFRFEELSCRSANVIFNYLDKRQFSKHDVSLIPKHHLLRAPNFGKKSLKEVEAWLAADGYSFKEE